MKRMTTIVALTLGLSPVTHAQVTSPTGHEQAAIELLAAMDMERQMLGGATAMADLMVAENPTLLPYRPVLLEWAQSFMTWEVFGPPMVKLYMEAFQESELREMTAFYRTPVGRKALELQPQLMSQAMTFASLESQRRADDLQERIRKRALELDSRRPSDSAGNAE